MRKMGWTLTPSAAGWRLAKPSYLLEIAYGFSWQFIDLVSARHLAAV